MDCSTSVKWQGSRRTEIKTVMETSWHVSFRLFYRQYNQLTVAEWLIIM